MYFLVLYIFYIFSIFFDTTDTLSVRTSGTSQVYCTPTKFKSNARETWHAILVSFADIYPTESLCILAERLSQSEIVLPLRKTCYYSPLAEVGVFSTEIKNALTSVSRCKCTFCLKNFVLAFISFSFWTIHIRRSARSVRSLR